MALAGIPSRRRYSVISSEGAKRLNREISTLLVLLSLSLPIFAEPNYYLLAYYPGATWNEAVDYAVQPGLKEHHAYIRQLHETDIMVMGGPVGDINSPYLSVMLIRTGSREEAESIADRDPGVQTRLLKAEVLPWQVNMSSARFVRRRPQPAIEDADQKFSIKRLDPNSRLNIDD